MIQPAAFYHWSYTSCLSYVMIFYYNLCPLHILKAQQGSLFKKQDLPAVTMKLIVSETLQLFFIISVQQKHITKTLAIGHRFWGQLEPVPVLITTTTKKEYTSEITKLFLNGRELVFISLLPSPYSHWNCSCSFWI